MGTAKKKAAADPHADCPPAVWDGIQWVCNNHGVPEVIQRTREAMRTQARPGAQAPTPRPVDTELHAEVAALGVQLAANSATLSSLIDDVASLQATVAASLKAAPKQSKG